MAATDDVYRAIYALRKLGREPETVTVPPTTYYAAYEYMHALHMLPGETVRVDEHGRLVTDPGPHYPLPVPEDKYKMWGVWIVKDEVG